MEIVLVALVAALGLATAALAWLLAATRQRTAAAEARLGEAQAQANAATSRLDAAVESRVAAERELAAAKQRLGDLELVLRDNEGARTELVTAARSAALETARELSAQLIGDHRRETKAAQEQAEKQTRELTEPLVKQIDTIVKTVAALDGQHRQDAARLDSVWRSLTSPGGSGQIAEIGLGNMLRKFGLEPGRDFELQKTTVDETGRQLRPDALVFVPGNSVLVIDSKASKFLIDIANAEGGAQEEAAYANLARTMNQHLRDLVSRDYRGAVLAGWRAAGRTGDMGRILSIMYLPNEAVLEKLARADAGFFARAREAEIIPAGPAGLHCVLSIAASEVAKERRAENQQRIVDGAQSLLESLVVALRAVTQVGKGIKAAAESFEDFTKSVNGRLLPRAKRLAGLGVALPPGKSLPSNLPAYTVMSQEGDHLIEGESSEIADEAAPRLVAE